MSSLGVLGSLVVSLEAGVAQFQADMGKAVYLVEQAGQRMDQATGRALGNLNANLLKVAAGVAAIASIDMVKQLVTDSIAATAALDDMAERTGASVEQLSKMADVAKIGGHQLDVVEAAAGRLVKGLSVVDDETKGVGKALDALGINGRDVSGNIRNLGELLPEIAQKLAGYNDSTAKAALAQDLFGKSGMKVLPFLKDYAELGNRAASVTAEQAAAAERYEKTLNALKLGKEQFTRTLVTAALPAMQAVADLMLKNQQLTDGLHGKTRALAADGSLRTWFDEAALSIAGFVDFLKTTVAAVEAVAGSFKVVGADIKLLGTIAGAVSGSPKALADLKTTYEERNKTLDAANKKYEELLNRDTEATKKALTHQLELNKLVARAQAGDFSDQNSRRERKPQELSYKVVDEQAIKKAAQELDKLKNLLTDLSGQSLGFSPDFNEKLGVLTGGYVKGRLSLDEYRKATEQLLAVQPYAKKATEEQAKAFDDAFEAMEKARLETEKQLRTAREMVEDMEFEVKALQMTNAEREIAIKLRKLEQDGVKQGTAAYDLFAQRIRAAVEAKEGLTAQIDLWKNIEQTAHDAWNNIGQGGQSVMKKLEQTLKSGLLEMLYQLTIKKWIIDISANVTGQGGGGIMGGGGGGLGNMLGNVANSFFGGGDGGGVMGGTIGSIGSGIASLGTAAFGAGSSMTGVGLGMSSAAGSGIFSGFAAGAANLASGATSAALAVGQMIPAIGIAVAAIYALHKAFGDKGENWKGQLGFGGNAQAYATTGVFGKEGFSHIAGDDSLNKQIQAFMESTGAVDKILARGLSETQIQAIQKKLGTYGATRTDGQPGEFAFGKDDDTAGEQLTVEYLKTKYGAVFDELNSKIASNIRAFSGTSEELLKLINTFARTQEVIAGFNDADPLGDAAKLYDASQRKMLSASEAARKGLEALMEAYDDSADSGEKLAQATASYYLAQVQLIAQIDGIIASVTEMFQQTGDAIRLAGMDDQGQYDFFQNRSNVNYEALLNSSDPEQIQKLAEKINADINAAFGLLSPEEQTRESGNFLDRLNDLNDKVTQRLKDVQKELGDETKTLLDQVGELLSGAATTQQAAADTQTTAADTQLQAAQTPTAVRVVLEAPDGRQLGTFDAVPLGSNA